ncbi:unnamed protein product [Tilletia controversa]|nr:unnamed protein product [Tilletia controversa]
MVDTRRKPAAALAQADAFIPTPTPSKTAAKSNSATVLGPLLLGLIYDAPLSSILESEVQRAVSNIGYSGLVLLLSPVTLVFRSLVIDLLALVMRHAPRSHHALIALIMLVGRRPLIALNVPVLTTERYYFQPTAHDIRILSRHTGATISTLTPPPLPQALSDNTIPAASQSITALALHPANPLQLLSASPNGSICVWDYLDAALLRIFFLPLPSSSLSTEVITHLVASEHHPNWAFVCARRPKRSSSSSSSSSPTTYSTITYALRLSLARSPSSSSSTNPSFEPITHISMPTASAGGGKERSVPVYIPRTQSRLGRIKLIPAAILSCPQAEQIYVASLQRTRAEGSAGGGEGMLVDGALEKEDEDIIACPEGLAEFTTSDTVTALAVHPTEKSIATWRHHLQDPQRAVRPLGGTMATTAAVEEDGEENENRAESD